MARAARKDSLAEYGRKRDFARTPEPKPKAAKRAAGNRFVVQKHAARRTHYDLRLELDGVLKSWAITRGPSLVPGEKRLAVRTEDHPMEYLDFEGNIPKGEYGGGAMIVWDRGRWVPEFDPHKGMAKGHLHFALEGGRLKGRWHLVRMRPKPGERQEPWLLIKSDDEFARAPGAPEIVEEEKTSAISGLTTEELAAQATLRADHAGRARAAKARKVALPDIGKVRGARKKLLPTFVEPSLASLAGRPPSGPKWVHEIKYDGYRIQARIDGDTVKLLTRKGLDWTERFAGVAAALKAMKLGSALLDGEIVVEDENGIPDFGELQADLASKRTDRFRYRVFDLLYCDGYDLAPATLLERKAVLQQILSSQPAGSIMAFSEHLAADGPTMLEHACRLGLEGIVSKRADLPYRSGRIDHWLKCKCVRSQEFAIVGYVPSTAAAKSIGSLVLGYMKGGKLHYAGRVGTGWSAAEAGALYDRLEPTVAKKPAFANPLPDDAEKGVRWTEPRLVCEVQFRGWSRDAIIRQSSYKGLREDKVPEEAVLEETPAVSAHEPVGAIAGVRLTHPDRLLWPDGLTKQGLAEFYAGIADWILPHLKGRLLSLLRSPAGIGEKGFFAKHPWAGLSEAVRRVNVDGEEMLAIENLRGLISLVQSGVVEIHPWGSMADDFEHPDRLIFDLDPGEDVPWADVIAAALEVRERLRALKLRSFVKTSGGKGLHVVFPIAPRVDWDTAKEFTKSIAEAMARDHRSRYVATMSKGARRGRIFVDYLRNGRGATAVAAYSTRARPHAPVSTPLAWEELTPAIGPARFTVHNLRQRLDFLKEDPWEGFFRLRQRLPV